MDYSAIISRWFFSISLLLVSVSGQRISCTVSGNVQEEESASLTCDYSTDLEEHGVGFYIYRYPLGGGDPDVPAICDWEKDFLRCDVSSGYKVRVQGHRMTLNISSAQQSHAGRYVCRELLPEGDIQSEQCDLVVQKRNNDDAKVSCHTIPNLHGKQPTTIVCLVSNTSMDTSIILERDQPSDSTTVETISCNTQNAECATKDPNYIGNQFNIKESSSKAAMVMVAIVDKDGRYTCRIKGSFLVTQTCSVSIKRDTQVEAAMETSTQYPADIVYVILVIVLVLLLGTCALFFYFYRRQGHKQNRKTVRQTDNVCQGCGTEPILLPLQPVTKQDV